jgi:hypothetical protein
VNSFVGLCNENSEVPRTICRSDGTVPKDRRCPGTFMEAGRETGLRWARDIEFLHFGLKGSPFHPQLGSCTGGTTDDPFRLAKCLENMLALGLFKGHSTWVFCMTRCPLQFCERHK